MVGGWKEEESARRLRISSDIGRKQECGVKLKVKLKSSSVRSSF